MNKDRQPETASIQLSAEDHPILPRKTYNAPKLTVWGTLLELTYGNATLSADFGGSGGQLGPVRRTPTSLRTP